jgi:hypothetical protein
MSEIYALDAATYNSYNLSGLQVFDFTPLIEDVADTMPLDFRGTESQNRCDESTVELSWECHDAGATKVNESTQPPYDSILEVLPAEKAPPSYRRHIVSAVAGALASVVCVTGTVIGTAKLVEDHPAKPAQPVERTLPPTAPAFEAPMPVRPTVPPGGILTSKADIRAAYDQLPSGHCFERENTAGNILRIEAELCDQEEVKTPIILNFGVEQPLIDAIEADIEKFLPAFTGSDSPRDVIVENPTPEALTQYAMGHKPACQDGDESTFASVAADLINPERYRNEPYVLALRPDSFCNHNVAGKADRIGGRHADVAADNSFIKPDMPLAEKAALLAGITLHEWSHLRGFEHASTVQVKDKDFYNLFPGSGKIDLDYYLVDATYAEYSTYGGVMGNGFDIVAEDPGSLTMSPIQENAGHWNEIALGEAPNREVDITSPNWLNVPLAEGVFASAELPASLHFDEYGKYLPYSGGQDPYSLSRIAFVPQLIKGGNGLQVAGVQVHFTNETGAHVAEVGFINFESTGVRTLQMGSRSYQVSIAGGQLRIRSIG